MQRFVDHIEKAIASSSIILSSNIQKQFGPDNETVYLKGNLLFIDSSSLGALSIPFRNLPRYLPGKVLY
jgi:hypothetical protein